MTAPEDHTYIITVEETTVHQVVVEARSAGEASLAVRRRIAQAQWGEPDSPDHHVRLAALRVVHDD